MHLYRGLSKSLALVLTFLMVVNTVPLSAADVDVRAASIGSVSAVGPVDLRGIRIQGDGTLFSGDRLNVGPGAYAKVALGAGPKVEVAAGSEVTVASEAGSVQVRMTSGNVAFKADGDTPVHVRIGTYEVTAAGDASGNVAYVGKDAFSVRVLTGAVTVRDTATKRSFSVTKGMERLVGLRTGEATPAFASLASASPVAAPAPPPRRQFAGLSKGGMIALFGTIAGAAAAIIVLTTRNDDDDDDAATRLAQLTALQNLSAISSSATATSSLATTVDNTADAALAAIIASNASNKAALQASAQVVISRATAANEKVAALNAALAALQDAISNQNFAPTSAQIQQINQLFSDLVSGQADANAALAELNALLTQATQSGVTGLPANPNLQPVQPPTIASASVPS